MIVVLILTVAVFTASLALPMRPVEAAVNNVLVGLINGFAEWAQAKEYASFLNSAGGRGVYAQHLAQKYGVDRDPELNKVLLAISNQVLLAVHKMEGVSFPYTVILNPQKDFNAVCGPGHNLSINRGLFTKLQTQDEVAFIVAHEIGQGQKNHGVNSLDKGLILSLLRRVAVANNPSRADALLAAIGYNLVSQKGISVPYEWEADNAAFEYATKAGFNPGAGAAAMIKMKEVNGERAVTIIGEILDPASHPTASSRIENYAKKLTEYSGGVVVVKNTTVFVNGKAFINVNWREGKASPQAVAFFIGGDLARAYHKYGKNVGEAEVDGEGRLMLRDVPILSYGKDITAAQKAAVQLNECNGIKTVETAPPGENAPTDNGNQTN